jgi:hypothetical protein
MKKRKLGDRINRGFAGLVFILGAIIAIRFAVAVTKYDVELIEWRESDFEYPETQDDCAETANGLGVPLELVDSIVDSAYVNGFFDGK